jgi:uracil-DNA glycosylase family 4
VKRRARTGGGRPTRRFFELSAGRELVLSRTGWNLTQILREIGASIDEVSYVDAVKCRPREVCTWKPGEGTRLRFRPLLEEQILALRPRLLVALGAVATTCCFEIADLRLRPVVRLRDVVGRVATWRASAAPKLIQPAGPKLIHRGDVT